MYRDPGSNGPMNHPSSLKMFWRLLLRSIFVKRPQAALAVGSLLVGAAVTTMLLNLYEDVHRKMTQEFRAYGANVVLSPRAADSRDPFGTGGVMDEDVLTRLEAYRNRIPDLAARPLLYVVVRLRRAPGAVPEVEPQNVVAVGTDFSVAGRQVTSLEPKGIAGGPGSGECVVGARVAERLRLGAGDPLEIEPPGPATGSPPQPRCQFRISNVVSTGASEDDQVFLALAELQRLAGFEKKLSLVELRVPGETAAVERAANELTRAFPGLDVRPVRQIVYSEGRVLGIIRWLVVSLTALILVIIALCIMATMTAIVLERRKDVAVMKALGASDRLVMGFFLMEGAALGLVAGLAGYFFGGILATALARRLFGVRLDWAWWALPLVSTASVLISVLATFPPVRIVRKVEPAVVLKGA